MLPKYRKPVTPGEILAEEFLHPLNISQAEFAEHMGGTWTQPKLNAIIRGKRTITESIALDLSDALGTTPQFWINLQNDVDLWEAIHHHKKIKLLPQLRSKRRSSLTLTKSTS